MIPLGAIYDARLDPTQGSELAGIRPVIIMSRDSLIANSTIVLAVPCSSCRGRRPVPSQALLRAPDGGLDVDSVAMAEKVHVLSHGRLLRQRGILSLEAIAFDLPGQARIHEP